MKKELLDRVPPHNLEAETAVLGSMMINTYAVDTVLQLLVEEDFFDRKHQVIFTAIVKLRERNEPVDIISVSDHLQATKDLERVGGSAYLSRIIEQVPSATNVSYYAQKVMGKSMLRNMINTCSNIIDNVYEYPADVTRVIDEAESAVIEASERRNRDDRSISMKNSVKGAFRRMIDMADGKIPYYGIFTGYPRLDSVLDGFQPGNLVIIAADTSSGKTAYAIKMMMNMHTEKGAEVPILYFTLEMQQDEITKRCFSIHSHVNYQILRRPKYLTPEHRKGLEETAMYLETKKIIINDKPRLNIMQIKAITRRMWRKHDIKVVFIDHIQIVGLEHNGESRNDRLGDVSAGLKELAKELNIVVIALSQLNKEGRLRDSGNIAQDADIILNLKRKPDDNVAELNIGKARESKLDNIAMSFIGDYMEFSETEPYRGEWS